MPDLHREIRTIQSAAISMAQTATNLSERNADLQQLIKDWHLWGLNAFLPLSPEAQLNHDIQFADLQAKTLELTGEARP